MSMRVTDCVSCGRGASLAAPSSPCLLDVLSTRAIVAISANAITACGLRWRTNQIARFRGGIAESKHPEGPAENRKFGVTRTSNMLSLRSRFRMRLDADAAPQRALCCQEPDQSRAWRQAEATAIRAGAGSDRPPRARVLPS